MLYRLQALHVHITGIVQKSWFADGYFVRTAASGCRYWRANGEGARRIIIAPGYNQHRSHFGCHANIHQVHLSRFSRHIWNRARPDGWCWEAECLNCLLSAVDQREDLSGDVSDAATTGWRHWWSSRAPSGLNRTLALIGHPPWRARMFLLLACPNVVTKRYDNQAENPVNVTAWRMPVCCNGCQPLRVREGRKSGLMPKKAMPC